MKGYSISYIIYIHARFVLALFLLSGLGVTSLFGQPDFQLSTNIYRVPYSSGHVVRINGDHNTHSPPGRYDMEGYEAGDICDYYEIVAAAGGIVRYAVDDNDTSCSGCGEHNNYVWLEHLNGEWSKYTHFSHNSVTEAGISVGDTICAGTFLGYECYVGSTSPPYNEHLHFELRLPNNPTNPPIDPAGGFLDNNDGAHLIPVINSLSKHWWEDSDEFVSVNDNSCTHDDINAGAQTHGNDAIKIYMASGFIHTNSNAVIFQNGSNGLFYASDHVLLTPNFEAQAGTSFRVRIGNCAATQYPNCD